MNLRQPVRAGSFYESIPSSCRNHAVKLIEAANVPDDTPPAFGGIVPHAGWSYSGRLAALTLKAVLRDPQVDTLVLLGADHCGTVRRGEVFDTGTWRSPLGDVQVNEALAQAIIRADGCLRANPKAHTYEHSLEVQVPIIQVLKPSIQIVPIGIPPINQAVQVGEVIGRVLKERFPHARVVGSSDLTHHGGHFPAPGGRGLQGVEWTEKNDQRILSLMENMQAAEIIEEAAEHGNACGAGAIAATVAAAKVMGSAQGLVLSYTNSYRIIHEQSPEESDDTAVGYASVVFA